MKAGTINKILQDAMKKAVKLSLDELSKQVPSHFKRDGKDRMESWIDASRTFTHITPDDEEIEITLTVDIEISPVFKAYVLNNTTWAEAEWEGRDTDRLNLEALINKAMKKAA